MKIGLVGEAPIDTMSLKTILLKRYSSLEFVELLKNKITGSSLDNKKTKTELSIECKFHKPDAIILIRDLDGFQTDKYRDKQLQRKQFFKDITKCIKKIDAIPLLNIWELEALIFADINAFNMHYGCEIVFNGNPMEVENPKEELFKLNQKYSSSHNEKIFQKSDFDMIYNNCSYFNDFIKKFETTVFSN